MFRQTHFAWFGVYTRYLPSNNIPDDSHIIQFFVCFETRLSIYIDLFHCSLSKNNRIVWYNYSCNININSGISLTISIQWNYILCVGNLSLNQSCIAHEQCSSSNYSRCVDEKCKCMEGYTAENLTSCIKCMVFISYYLHQWSYIMPVITNVS